MDRPARTFVLPVPLIPDGRTIRHRPKDRDGDSGTDIFIPVTNALESLHRSLRKIIKTRSSFPNNEAATRLLFLAICNAGVHCRRPIEWTAAMGQFAILFEDRFPGLSALRPESANAQGAAYTDNRTDLGIPSGRFWAGRV